MVCIASARPWIALFGSVDCEDCMALKSRWQEDYVEEDDPVLIFLPIEHLPNYNLLGRIEKALPDTDRVMSLPVMLLGKKLIGDIEEFWEQEDNFPELAEQHPDMAELAAISEFADTSSGSLVEFKYTDKTAVENAVSSAKGRHLAFFHQTNCAKCSRQEKELEILMDRIPELVIDRYNVADVASLAMLARFYEQFKIERTDENLIPLVCWSNGYITGRLATAEELEKNLQEADGEYFWKSPVSTEEINAEKNREKAVIKTFLITSVISGGLADGINPCAFATSLFLISYLIMRKRRRREVAVIGIMFCAGVFVAYFLYGLGLSFLIDLLNGIPGFKMVLYLIFGLISAVLALLHLRDAFKYRRSGNVSDMDMGLSKDTHRGIHEKIRKYLEYKNWIMIPASFVLGSVVSSMELACTGQVYFTTLLAINSYGMTLRSVSLLILYNICFIVPLLLVTWMAVRGNNIKAVTDWAKNNVFSTKLIMAAVFLLIAIIMFVMAF